MRTANILALVAAIVWGAMFCVGMDGLKDVADRAVLGYPASAQFDFYIGTPFVIVGAVAASALLANIFQRFWIAAGAVSAAALAALFPYLIVYGGGV